MNRRDVLRGGIAFTIGAPTMVATAIAYDPLLVAIKNYNDGCAAYCNFSEAELVADEDAIIERTYAKPMDILGGWDQPALTRECASAALKLIRDERHLEGMGVALSMLTAALAYLESASA